MVHDVDLSTFDLDFFVFVVCKACKSFEQLNHAYNTYDFIVKMTYMLRIQQKQRKKSKVDNLQRFQFSTTKKKCPILFYFCYSVNL